MPDGRTLAYLATGDPGGALLIHNHGGPSSRLEAKLFADSAAKHGIHFVCVDRPGIGLSSPQEQRTFSGWADDLIAIADSLGHEKFGVTGWSEGGPWALAAAAYIDPARLRHVSALAPGSYGAFGDNSAAKHLSKIDALGGFLALHMAPGFRLLYATLGITAAHFQSSYIKQLRAAVNDSDRKILDGPVAEAFAEMSAECFAQGSEGLVRDAMPLYRRWDFDVSAIKRPVHFWQGTGDTLVPLPINREVADHMPGAVWHEVDGAGHLIALGCADEILAIAGRELRASK
ncbi:MAG: alpha/beta hydrolase [Verrucomicrobia bacterium]|nr:alpha/beta hydrolase [Verrucomicrobiota bacterium]